MKKKQLITAMLAMAAATAATSASASIVETVGGITFQLDKVAASVGAGTQKYDIWDITVTNLTGSDGAAGQNGVGISSYNGTFAVTGTGSATNSLLTPGTSSTGVKNNWAEGSDGLSAANPGGGSNYTGVSYVNFDTYTSFSRAGQTPSTSTNHSTWSTSMTANLGILNGVYIGPSSDVGGPPGIASNDNPLFGELIVTAGSNWTYSGSFTSASGHVNSGASLTTVQAPPTGATISLTSTATNTSSGTEIVTGSNGSYHVVSDVSGLSAATGTIAVNDIGNEAGTYIVGLKISGNAATVLADLQGGNAGWTFTNVNGGSIAGLPGTGWNIEATTANPSGAGANDFVNWSIPAGDNSTVTEVAAIPEPSTLGLIGLGTVLAAHRRRRSA